MEGSPAEQIARGEEAEVKRFSLRKIDSLLSIILAISYEAAKIARKQI